MKLIIAVLALVMLASCSRQPMLHVTHADPCDRPSIVGTIGNKEYALNVKNPPLYLACPGLLRMDAVGKDFPVTVDMGREEMTLQISGAASVLVIDSVREK